MNLEINKVEYETKMLKIELPKEDWEHLRKLTKCGNLAFEDLCAGILGGYFDLNGFGINRPEEENTE